MPVASTTKAHTVVSASMDIIVMERSATISTSVVIILVMPTRYAEIQTVRIFVAVNPAIKAMESHVLIMMSAKKVLTIVTRKLYVIILGAHIAVSALKVIVEMVTSAKVKYF